MEDDMRGQRESISLTPTALGVENAGAEFLESLEEGRLPGSSDSSPHQGGHTVERKRLWGWRSLHRALPGRPSALLRWMGTGLLCAAYAAFLLAACLLDFQRALALCIVTCVVLTFLAHSLLKRCLGPTLSGCAMLQGNPRLHLWFNRALALTAVLGLALWLALDTSQRPEQLVSFAGICVIVSLLFACSKHRHAVSWQAVTWGLGLQFVLGLFVIRTELGFIAFQWLGDQIHIFLSYTTAGSAFVFGEALVKDVFAFQVLPIIVFFSCVMSVLYYMGLMQWVILKISWLMQITMGTTATETLSVAGNIFVSQIDASSLIAASVMAAPCALALSKLVYPEAEESKFRSEEVRLSYGVPLLKPYLAVWGMPMIAALGPNNRDAQNLVEALSSGAAASVKVVANIATNLIAFLAVLAFINAALSWLGALVDIPGLSFQLICSYVLRPVAFLMGVPWEDCPVVAELLGTKLFLNEFVAYQGLSEYKRRRLAGAEEWVGARKQWISVRAETLTTFALCGFANVSSIGIMLGGLTSLVPHRRSDFARLVLRALFTGACVSLVNACVAGILYVPRGPKSGCGGLLNHTLSSSSFEVYQCCRRAFQSTSPELSLALRENCCRFYNHTICA
ncbi:sodium/nucleoside cotransporter 1 isoform X5 [Heterocephalus glaber]|uniref:Sodium/nucleoside cotransporter 1 isoform X5 n=1 Tax=Heterocephalus glaber TaxID=10181 RepID=A0AAX6PI98_HETGA|nr:sodium/nucleoside cotransporter 1 isoform X5 [Heterocephalus glaber]